MSLQKQHLHHPLSFLFWCTIIALPGTGDEHLVIKGPCYNLLHLEPIFLVPMLGDGDAIQSPGLYLSYYPSDNFLGGRSKESSLATMGMQVQLQINLSFPLKLRRPLLLKSPDPLHPVTGGLNQEIEVGFEP